MSISIGSGWQGAVVVCTGSELEVEEAEDWSFLMLKGVVLVDLALHIVSIGCSFSLFGFQ